VSGGGPLQRCRPICLNTLSIGPMSAASNPQSGTSQMWKCDAAQSSLPPADDRFPKEADFFGWSGRIVEDRMQLFRAVITTLWFVLVMPAAASTATSLTPEPAHRLVRFDIRGSSIAFRYPAGRSISFRYPANWHVTTRRLDDVIDPHTLFAVTSYTVPKGPVGDCDGTHARSRPVDGVFVLVKEVLDGASLRRSLPRLPTKPRAFQLPKSGRAGCLAPPSILYQFRVAQRAFYVWISIGPKASAKTRAAVARLLDGMWIASYRTP
jgi:hypothetical protein